MSETKNVHRESLKKRIDSARNLNKLRRTKTDTVAEVKPTKKERRPTDVTMVAPPPALRSGQSLDAPSMEVITKTSLRRGSSFDPASLSAQLSDSRHKKHNERWQSEVRKSMKHMDPSNIIHMLENLALADGDQADE